MTTRICLNAIVRNESKNILRMLRSVAPIIDCWSITDTGSTDDTLSKVYAFFLGHNIPGNLWTQPFVDFATTRNWSLDRSENSFLAEHFDYHLLVDADMVWCGVIDKEALTEDAYYIRQKDKPSGAEYDNLRIVKRGIGAQYVGVTHEYLDVGGLQGPWPKLRGGMFIDHADGANRPGKFERDIALLKAEVEKNPDDARSVFYLAQSYRDNGQFQKAASTYLDRSYMENTWEEEKWYALLMYARCLDTMGVDATGIWKLCHNERPWRREPLKDLARYYLDKANAITDTKDDILFLEP